MMPITDRWVVVERHQGRQVVLLETEDVPLAQEIAETRGGAVLSADAISNEAVNRWADRSALA